MSPTSTPPQTVHQRTLKGQMAAVTKSPLLDAAHAKLLLLFNGFTPTELLVEIASDSASQSRIVAQELERDGLIEKVH